MEVFVLLIDNGVSAVVKQICWIDVSRQRKDLPSKLERIAHDQRIGVARHWYQVISVEYICLLQDFSSHFRECNPVGSDIEMVDSSSDLCWLKRDTPNTGLF